MSQRSGRRYRRGVTLIEIAIAVLILSLGAVAAIGLMANTSRANEYTREVNIAYKGCQEVMEALLSMEFDDMIAQDNVKFQVPRLGTNLYIGTISVQDVDGKPGYNLAEITVGVKYKHINVQIVTQRSRL